MLLNRTPDRAHRHCSPSAERLMPERPKQLRPLGVCYRVTSELPDIEVERDQVADFVNLAGGKLRANFQGTAHGEATCSRHVSVGKREWGIRGESIPAAPFRDLVNCDGNFLGQRYDLPFGVDDSLAHGPVDIVIRISL